MKTIINLNQSLLVPFSLLTLSFPRFLPLFSLAFISYIMLYSQYCFFAANHRQIILVTTQGLRLAQFYLGTHFWGMLSLRVACLFRWICAQLFSNDDNHTPPTSAIQDTNKSDDSDDQDDAQQGDTRFKVFIPIKTIANNISFFSPI